MKDYLNHSPQVMFFTISLNFRSSFSILRLEVNEVKSKVYFSSAKAKKFEESLPVRTERVFEEARIADGFQKNDIVAVKTHLGERGGYRFLRPQFLSAVVKKVREHGGRPIVVDTTGIGLTSNRGDAFKYYEIARVNGFTQETIGAPVLIADGIKGFTGVKIPVHGGHRLKEVEIAQMVAEADAIVSVAHFKGHPRTGIGGAIKNLSLGCPTKSGRAPLHLKRKPWVKADKCDGCGDCVRFCPASAIQLIDGKAVVDEAKCYWGCGCWEKRVCGKNAISAWGEMHHETNQEFCLRAADALKAVADYFKGKIGYINFIMDVTPHCDCFDWSDLPLVPDIGVAASKDPVALDKACMDLVNAAPIITTGPAPEILGDVHAANMFRCIGKYSPIAWTENFGGPTPDELLEACAQLKLGEMEYEIVEIS